MTHEDDLDARLSRELKSARVFFDDARADEMIRTATTADSGGRPHAWVAPLAAAAVVVAASGGIALLAGGHGGHHAAGVVAGGHADAPQYCGGYAPLGSAFAYSSYIVVDQGTAIAVASGLPLPTDLPLPVGSATPISVGGNSAEVVTDAPSSVPSESGSAEPGTAAPPDEVPTGNIPTGDIPTTDVPTDGIVVGTAAPDESVGTFSDGTVGTVGTAVPGHGRVTVFCGSDVVRIDSGATMTAVPAIQLGCVDMTTDEPCDQSPVDPAASVTLDFHFDVSPGDHETVDGSKVPAGHKIVIDQVALAGGSGRIEIAAGSMVLEARDLPDHGSIDAASTLTFTTGKPMTVTMHCPGAATRNCAASVVLSGHVEKQ